jgi:hypothetical protein
MRGVAGLEGEENKRADYGKQIIVTLARQLQDKHGK